MRALLLTKCQGLEQSPRPLRLAELPDPQPAPDEVVIKVKACAVCRTDLDIIEGRLRPSLLPLVLGHQITGEIVACGKAVADLKPGLKVGLGWIYQACSKCEYCLTSRENLCPHFRATGKDVHGGYAEYTLAKERFTLLLPSQADLILTAPLLCAGGVGYRALRLTGLRDGQTLGLVGFGASAHLLLKLIKSLHPYTTVFVFARSRSQQEFARSLGAAWSGSLTDSPPAPCDALLDTTPIWQPLLSLLPFLKPGGRYVINAIRKEDKDKELLGQLTYENHLWLEKCLLSTANATSADLRDFLELAFRFQILPEIKTYDLVDTNQALLDLKRGDQLGAKVIVVT